MPHGSQEWGGKGLGRLKMVPKSVLGMVWEVFHGSQERGAKGLGRLRMKHEKGFGCFMVSKSGVGRVWEGKK